MRDDVGEHPEAERLRGDLMKLFRRANSNRLVRALGQSMSLAPFETWSGLFAGNYPAFDVDLRRLSAVAARIARGLFYHVTGDVLPATHAVLGSVEPFANSDDPDGLEDATRELLTSEPTILGNGVFSYRVRFVDGRTHDSQWFFEFYQAVPFLCMTIDETALEPRPETKFALGGAHIIRPVRLARPSGVIVSRS